MDRLHSMQVFDAVASEGGFAAAAKVLNLSPQMVSYHIRTLEEFLGVRLITRTTRKMTLTEAGHRYWQKCQRLLEELHQVESDVRAWNTIPQGVLKVCAPLTFGYKKIAPAMADFAKLYPEISIDLILSDQIQDIVAEGIEVAFRIGELADSNLVARPLQPYELMLAASPDYLATQGTPQSPQELRNHSCLVHGFSRSRQTWQIEDEDSVHQIPVSGVVKVNHGDALIAIARAGGGIVYQPRVLLDEYIQSGHLVEVLPACKRPKQPLHILYSKSQQRVPKVDVFVQFALARWASESRERSSVQLIDKRAGATWRSSQSRLTATG